MAVGSGLGSGRRGVPGCGACTGAADSASHGDLGITLKAL